MRILYFDLDSQRPDHLGCYGYHRKTSPNIDRVAAAGVRFDNYYVSDAPCLPSRTAMWSGKFGYRNGVTNHGGARSEPYPDGALRGFRSSVGQNNWMTALRRVGYRTATVSSFGERHSAFHWYAGFNDILNCGGGGNERAEHVSPLAIDWLKRHGREDHWFLHVNFWDAHTPYRTPPEHASLFADDPLPAWLTEEVRQQHWQGCGPHSAREICGYSDDEPWSHDYPQQPRAADSMAAVRAMFDGYDRGIRHSDDHVARVLNTLSDLNVLHDTAVIITADHGENLGELNVYGDHQTADQHTSRVPLIVSWPGVTSPLATSSLHYHFDFAATLLDLAGGTIPDHWDGQSFAPSLKSGQPHGRPHLILSQGAWSCQRAVRFEDHILIRSFHDGYHAFPDTMLFNLKDDPHEQHDLAPSRPDLVSRANSLLDAWQSEMSQKSRHEDPFQTTLRESGPFHTRGHLPAYLARLRATGRSKWADVLAAKHPTEISR